MRTYAWLTQSNAVSRWFVYAKAKLIMYAKCSLWNSDCALRSPRTQRSMSSFSVTGFQKTTKGPAKCRPFVDVSIVMLKSFSNLLNNQALRHAQISHYQLYEVISALKVSDVEFYLVFTGP